MEQGVNHAIGDGHATKFWLHSWADHRPLRELITRSIPGQDRDLLVSDYWDPGRGWRWEAFTELLPPRIQQQIASFEVLEERAPDNFYWKNEPSGRHGLSNYMNCASCHGDWEDMAHILWGCLEVSEVWSFLESKGFQCRALNMDVATWIKENTQSQKEDPTWPT
ncbi:hypothetical protein Cgig2_022469 [Carnegiea gigantea]|uniref:Reverse transcriptase zinc-binding domain-containing protein n=1 Tax=Carnegiea gigantea TaxID=171969 RepID=A0A9Q1QEN0_9CARY|nr:hypothetical protein Cgig2_022469 [Carnegiea gigantea]